MTSAPSRPQRDGRRKNRTSDPAALPWAGAKRDYDLVKEFVIAIVVVGALVITAAAVFSSPDEKAISVATWAQQAPNDFVLTATTELASTSPSAGYGPPYNNTQGTTQQIGPLDLQKAAGVRIPIDSANDFVIRPLSTLAPAPDLSSALTTWRAAGVVQQQSWGNAYADALTAAPSGDPAKVAPGDFGPVPVLVTNLLGMAQRGQLQPVIQGEGGFYNTDYTRSTLFLSDGTYLEDAAVAQHLGGDQWGMMNETGSYPGQSWMWLYTFWYQIEPFKSSPNADALVWGLMLLLSLGLVLIPVIPGVRSIPRRLPVHRLIWRQYYRSRSNR